MLNNSMFGFCTWDILAAAVLVAAVVVILVQRKQHKKRENASWQAHQK